jgi:hypothetical protein
VRELARQAFRLFPGDRELDSLGRRELVLEQLDDAPEATTAKRIVGLGASSFAF